MFLFGMVLCRSGHKNYKSKRGNTHNEEKNDLVDFGAQTGPFGAFEWFAAFPAQ